MGYLKLSDLDSPDIQNKRVIIREDFNVPIQNGIIADDSRIRAALPTIEYALKQHAAIILLSHLGRPMEGEFHPEFSLKLIAEKLSQLLQKPVRFIADMNWIDGIDIKPGEIVLCENVRFQSGEKRNDSTLSKKIAALGDIFVMDAFATAHRAESSTVGAAQYSKIKCAGLLLDAELTALSTALDHPKKPVAAIVGGSKVSTKITILENLLDKINILIVGGGIANTFLAAANFPIGKSLVEPDFLPQAKKLLETAKIKNILIPLPVDVVVSNVFSKDAKATLKLIQDVAKDEMILDIGPKTAKNYAEILKIANTIIWNGPVGVFEFPNFENGTKAIAQAIAKSHAFSVAGGGDTISAINQFGVHDKISYISTGGGAFLEWMEGKTLPGVAVLTASKL